MSRLGGIQRFVVLGLEVVVFLVAFFVVGLLVVRLFIVGLLVVGFYTVVVVFVVASRGRATVEEAEQRVGDVGPRRVQPL